MKSLFFCIFIVLILFLQFVFKLFIYTVMLLVLLLLEPKIPWGINKVSIYLPMEVHLSNAGNDSDEKESRGEMLKVWMQTKAVKAGVSLRKDTP